MFAAEMNLKFWLKEYSLPGAVTQVANANLITRQELLLKTAGEDRYERFSHHS
jgi:hypothetical protein